MSKLNSFLELAEERQSNRAYHPDRKVSREQVQRCIEAARLAPSACNSQPWHFIVVDDEGLKNRIADTTTTKMIPMNHFTKQAPVHVVVLLERSNFTASLGNAIRNKEFNRNDVGMAVQNFCLQAAFEGLGTCILGWFNEKKVKQLLNIPKPKRAELIITLGYPADGHRPKRRKELQDITSYNAYKVSDNQ